MTNYFWSDSAQKDWPSNLPNHIFLADAACQYGKAKFGKRWRDEGFNFIGSRRPKFYLLKTVKESWVEEFLMREELKRTKFAYFSGLLASVVARDILEHAQYGRVKLEARPYTGGLFTKIDHSVIDIDRMMHIFTRCSIDVTRPFVQTTAGRGNSEVFMTLVSFGGLMKSVRAPKVTDAELTDWVRSNFRKHSQAELVMKAKTAFPDRQPPVRARVRAVDEKLRLNDETVGKRKRGAQSRT